MSVVTITIAQQVLAAAGIVACNVHLTPIFGGLVNKLYELSWESGKIVLWLDGKAGETRWGNRGLKLRWVYESLACLNLPIPRLIYAGGPDGLIPCHYMLLTHLPGQQIKGLLTSTDLNQITSIATAAGQALNKFHKATATSIGSIRNHAVAYGGRGKYGDPFRSSSSTDNWPDYVERQLSIHIDAHKRTGSLGLSRLNAITQFIQERRVLWAAPTHWQYAVLIHSDYSSKNIHVQSMPNGTWSVCGIFDFEWSLIGPAAMDFAKLEAYGFPKLTTLEQTASYKEAFLESYQQVEILPPEHHELVTTYELLFYLVWAKLEQEREHKAGFQAAEQAIDMVFERV